MWPGLALSTLAAPKPSALALATLATPRVVHQQVRLEA